MQHFSRPRATNGKAFVYNANHPSWKQGTSRGKTYHFMKFAYDTMAHVEWAFPLGDYYYKTCAGAVRLVTGARFSDLRLWGTPVQFKYKWAVQQVLGAATPGVHTFTISANITHAALANGVPRWNFEYNAWVSEQQQEHLLAVKEAITNFPVRPLRRNHTLAGQVHPLKDWATLPTPLSSVVLTNAEADAADATADAAADAAADADAPPPPLPTAAAADEEGEEGDDDEVDIYSSLSDDSGDSS